MNEVKGGIFAMFFFLAFIFPFLLGVGIDSLHQHSFMKMTTEMHELVKEEGGVGEKTQQFKKTLESKGYTITFTDQKGSPVNGKVNYGDVVHVDYVYTYKSVREKHTLHTKNKVFVMKRNNS
ncbi:hypothetical protein [Pseudobacillus badius]|uniref:hypothetical protein n=1 Tax=Bacillus badius TaxID=1455 RepID=UPI000597A14D|nr:hypothetical protein [Bacillus badius]KIL74676.1 hypothetical protein SD78_1745 [Bacillus badius]UAT32408.1 hypothetical protein K7T73_09445 [Bacillus badius]GLY12881.1 hypothetical protein Bbad01_40970 [Bacillus badius]